MVEISHTAVATNLPLLISRSYLILVFPLLAFIINGLWLGRKNRFRAGWFSTVCAGFSLIWAIGVAVQFYNIVLTDPVRFPARTLIACNFDWLFFRDDLIARLGIYLDPISVMMLVVITLISFLVTIYSMGYMREDASSGRFFALLSFFSFSMLGLVTATNIFQMFIFWELVGVSSYLLIGFWYHKPSAVAASKKAFIVTRFADAFFLLGIIIITYHTGDFDFLVLNSPAAAAALDKPVSLGICSVNALTVCTLLIFLGGWGKSAMFPLHIWLPDAMEGPTPVSSIIHSATMVVAGVFLTARMFPLFAAADFTLLIVQVVGAFTAIFAAVIACTQKDIKRILAFSTLSQLGYMMFSLGAARLETASAGPDINSLGYTAAMFHVFTHAFFKCMLFLGAGSVIHVVHSNDVDHMGGLKKHMPWTYWSLAAACLAIAGIFPFSGFWSKDEIILTALQSGHYGTFVLGLAVGGLTAFYMFRFLFLIFHGKPRSQYQHVHEDGYMTFSIVILVIPTVIAGWLCKDFFGRYILPAMQLPEGHFSHPAWLPWLATCSGLIGLGAAWLLYAKPAADIETIFQTENRPLWYRIIYRKFYIDEIYLFVTLRIIFGLIAAPAKWFDRMIVDGTVNMIGALCRVGGYFVRLHQSGRLTVYVATSLIGILFIYYMRYGL